MEGVTVDFIQKNKKIINIVYLWHVELSSDHNICLQEFYRVRHQNPDKFQFKFPSILCFRQMSLLAIE